MNNCVFCDIALHKIPSYIIDENDEIIAILKKEVKALNEAIGFLGKANKPEELAEEQEKKSIIESYLPQMLNREQTENLIKEIIEKQNITDLKT